MGSLVISQSVNYSVIKQAYIINSLKIEDIVEIKTGRTGFVSNSVGITTNVLHSVEGSADVLITETNNVLLTIKKNSVFNVINSTSIEQLLEAKRNTSSTMINSVGIEQLLDVEKNSKSSTVSSLGISNNVVAKKGISADITNSIGIEQLLENSSIDEVNVTITLGITQFLESEKNAKSDVINVVSIGQLVETRKNIITSIVNPIGIEQLITIGKNIETNIAVYLLTTNQSVSYSANKQSSVIEDTAISDLVEIETNRTGFVVNSVGITTNVLYSLEGSTNILITETNNVLLTATKHVGSNTVNNAVGTEINVTCNITSGAEVNIEATVNMALSTTKHISSDNVLSSIKINQIMTYFVNKQSFVIEEIRITQNITTRINKFSSIINSIGTDINISYILPAILNIIIEESINLSLTYKKNINTYIDEDLFIEQNLLGFKNVNNITITNNIITNQNVVGRKHNIVDIAFVENCSNLIDYYTSRFSAIEIIVSIGQSLNYSFVFNITGINDIIRTKSTTVVDESIMNYSDTITVKQTTTINTKENFDIIRTKYEQIP